MPETTPCENGEVQPDDTQPAGGTPEHRDDGHRIEKHNRPITHPQDAGAAS